MTIFLFEGGGDNLKFVVGEGVGEDNGGLECSKQISQVSI